MSVDDGVDFVYVGRQQGIKSYLDLYDCNHCHTTISSESLEKHYTTCPEIPAHKQLAIALMYVNRECYGRD